MAEFSRLVITDKGSNLVMKTIRGNEKIRFTRLGISTRGYQDAELKDLVLLEEIRQQVNISEINVESSSTIQIRAIVPNTDLTEGYYMKSVGLYAEDPDEGEILYGIAMEKSDNGCYVPPYNHRTVSNMYFNLSVAVGNSENVQLEVNPGAIVTIGQLDAAQKKIIDMVYQQATGYTDQRIADLIDGAPTTLDTLGEIASAMQENADIVEALDAAIGSKASEAEFDSHKKVTEALLGNTDISGIGDGTITGALSELNTGRDLVGGTMITNTVPSGQNITVNKLTLSPGIWLITSHVSFTTSVDATYAHALIVGQTEGVTVRTSMDGGGGTAIPYLISITDTTTIIVIVNSSSPTTMTLESNLLRATKL